MNGTLKQCFDTIEELKTIYPFEDDKTYLSTYDLVSHGNNKVQLMTTDEKTGATVIIEKSMKRQELF